MQQQSSVHGERRPPSSFGQARHLENFLRVGERGSEDVQGGGQGHQGHEAQAQFQMPDVE